ncbi:MAG: hypothetical protein Tsb002_37550 [Wenzhouxiangellaceae bacterium]
MAATKSTNTEAANQAAALEKTLERLLNSCASLVEQQHEQLAAATRRRQAALEHQHQLQADARAVVNQSVKHLLG